MTHRTVGSVIPVAVRHASPGRLAGASGDWAARLGSGGPGLAHGWRAPAQCADARPQSVASLWRDCGLAWGVCVSRSGRSPDFPPARLIS